MEIEKVRSVMNLGKNSKFLVNVKTCLDRMKEICDALHKISI